MANIHPLNDVEWLAATLEVAAHRGWPVSHDVMSGAARKLRRLQAIERLCAPLLEEHAAIAVELWRNDQEKAMDDIAILLTRELHDIFDSE